MRNFHDKWIVAKDFLRVLAKLHLAPSQLNNISLADCYYIAEILAIKHP